MGSSTSDAIKLNVVMHLSSRKRDPALVSAHLRILLRSIFSRILLFLRSNRAIMPHRSVPLHALRSKWEALMSKLTFLLIVLCLVLGLGHITTAQQIHLPPAVSQSQSMGTPPVTSGDEVQKRQAIAANQQRQLEIRNDTEKMAELTQELKDYLAKNDKSVMSLDAIKKAEQIEKLAHSVKSKMKQSF